MDTMAKGREIEMFVAGLVLDQNSNAPIVILKDATGEVCLPIWIGLPEATAIASALRKVDLARPLTHDLLISVLKVLSAEVVRVVISELRENTFIANIEMRVGDTFQVIDSRPSDAIAVAVRVGARIVVAEEVLEKAQVKLVAMNPEEAGEGEGEDQTITLDEKNFANIEKDKWAEILAEMDPDDFKYKM